MKTGAKFLIGLVAVALAVGGITFFNRIRRTSSSSELVKEVKRSSNPVRTIKVKRADLTETIKHTGSLAANRDVTLTAEVVGKVLRTYKDLGDRCRKGQVLVQLDSESYRIGLLQAEARLKQGQVQLEQAKRDHKRTDQLAKRSTVAGQTLERAQTTVATTVASVKQAEAAVKLARRNLRNTSVRCPFDGVVATRMVDVGQTVGLQTPIARLVDTTTLKLEVKISAARLSRLRVGQQATLSDPSHGQGESQPPQKGRVSRLGVAADPVTHTFPVEVEVPGEGALKPGQVVKCTITVAVHEGALAVPEEAIVKSEHDTERRGLYLFGSDGKARRVKVTLGPRIDDQVIVTSGLEPGDEVIVVGHHGLKAGDKVEHVTRDKRTPRKVTKTKTEARRQANSGTSGAPRRGARNRNSTP